MFISFHTFVKMRKIVFIFFLLLSLSGYSQYKTDYGFSVGPANYLGEMGGEEATRRDGIADMKLSYTRWMAGGFLRYKLNSSFSGKVSLNYIRLSGDDAASSNPGRNGRNLKFRNDMIEFTATGEFSLYRVNDLGGSGRYTADFNLYLFGGGGLFFSNPKGEYNGNWYALQPRQTEGVAYSKFNVAIPAGIGFFYTFKREYRIGFEIGYRMTFTDYIDDASTVYVTHTDPITAGLANRTTQEVINEINEGSVALSSYRVGARRGNPDDNDSYFTTSFNFSWVLKGKSMFSKPKHRWVLGKGSSTRRRRSRAKF